MKKYVYIAIAALALTACSSDDDSRQVAEQLTPISLSGTLKSAQEVTRAKTTIQPAQIVQNMQVGVFFLDDVAEATEYSNFYDKPNLLYHADGDGALTSDGDVPYYFPADGNKLKIYAYAPYRAAAAGGWNLTGTNEFIVKKNQVDSANYVASDLLYGIPVTPSGNPLARTEDDILLQFDHKLTKIIVKMVAGPGMDEDDLMETINGVYITNTKRTATVTMGTMANNNPNVIDHVTASGTADGEGTNGLMMGNSKSDCAAIVVPQTVSANTNMLHITTSNGGTFDWAPSEDFTLLPGKVYTITGTSSLKAITVKTQVNAWTAGGSESPLIEK